MLGDVDGNTPVVPEAAPCAAQHGVALTDARRPSSHNLHGRSAPRRVDDRRRLRYAVIRARSSDSSARSSATTPAGVNNVPYGSGKTIDESSLMAHAATRRSLKRPSASAYRAMGSSGSASSNDAAYSTSERAT